MRGHVQVTIVEGYTRYTTTFLTDVYVDEQLDARADAGAEAGAGAGTVFSAGTGPKFFIT